MRRDRDDLTTCLIHQSFARTARSDGPCLPIKNPKSTIINRHCFLFTSAILTLAELGTSGAWTAGDRITLIGYSTGTWNGGLFTYLSNTLNDDSSITFSGINWTFNYNDTTFGDNYQSDMSSFGVSARYVTMTAVPEPRAALLGGLGVLALLRRRRNA